MMHNKFKVGDIVLIIGIGKCNNKKYYRRKGRIICRDPYYKDYNIKLEDGTVLLPNDLYKLTEDVFRLYYTSKSTDQQKIDIYVEDNFGQTEQISFNFNNKKEER